MLSETQMFFYLFLYSSTYSACLSTAFANSNLPRCPVASAPKDSEPGVDCEEGNLVSIPLDCSHFELWSEGANWIQATFNAVWT